MRIGNEKSASVELFQGLETTWPENALLVEVPEELACPRFNCNTNHRASCSPGWKTVAGEDPLSLYFGMESTTGASRLPLLAEFAREKTYSSGLRMPKAGWSIRLSQSKESLVDETGIEPATSSLRTM